MGRPPAMGRLRPPKVAGPSDRHWERPAARPDRLGDRCGSTRASSTSRAPGQALEAVPSPRSVPSLTGTRGDRGVLVLARHSDHLARDLRKPGAPGTAHCAPRRLPHRWDFPIGGGIVQPSRLPASKASVETPIMAGSPVPTDAVQQGSTGRGRQTTGNAPGHGCSAYG